MSNVSSFPTSKSYTNRILQNLSAESIERLHLRPVRLDAGQEIESPGSAINYLIFPEAGAASMTTTFLDGSQVEVGLYGFESVIGLSAFMGVKRSPNRIYMQIAGHGFASAIEHGRLEFARGDRFQQLLLAFSQARFLRVAQAAGCNVKHDIEQRLATWLLTCSDRCRSMTVPISQEFLATMLGVRRMSAVAAIGKLKSLGLIEHHRAQILIVDPVGLAAKACECHRAIRDYLGDPLDFDAGHVAKPVSSEPSAAFNRPRSGKDALAAQDRL